MADTIIKIGAVAGAVAAIIAFIKMIALPVHKFIKNVMSTIERNERHNKENYINVLQLKIMAPYMPLEERVAAGFEYTEVMHQDGPAHLKYEVLQEEYKKKYGVRYQKEMEAYDE